jgi:hypothetical protein
MKSLSCPNRHCSASGKGDPGAIIRHGFYTTRVGGASSLPMPDLWKDPLLDSRDTLLPTSASARHL